MNKGERSFEDREIAIFRIREQVVWLPSRRERKEALTVAFRPLERKLLKAAETQRDLIKSELSESRRRLESAGEFPSRPQICGRYILNGMYVPSRDLAFQMYREGKVEDFILWHDIGYGLISVIARVALAEQSIKGHVGSLATEIISVIEERLGAPESPTSQAQAYMRLTADATEVERLLIKDPSAFLIIDEFVRRLKEPVQEQGGQRLVKHPLEGLVVDFVIAGAELAQKGYKTIYPLSAASFSHHGAIPHAG